MSYFTKNFPHYVEREFLLIITISKTAFILDQLYPLHTLTSYFYNGKFILILPPTRYFRFIFPHQYSVRIFIFSKLFAICLSISSFLIW